jgi:UDP:flavonoid glycosyltransferase YjiC (YdhE family)
LVLALFSRWLAEHQIDWPRQTIQPGFIWFDQNAGSLVKTPQLSHFLASGEPPIIFTQGSTAVNNAGDFYAVSAEAARMLNRRALLVGANSFSSLNSPSILAIPYAPYAQIFPFGAVNVHQGGSGTTGQALRAGRPQLIVPYGWDQPDNAARVERLGVGLHLPRAEWSQGAAAVALKRLLRDDQISQRATRIASEIQAEDGLTSACDAVEALLRRWA